MMCLLVPVYVVMVLALELVQVLVAAAIVLTKFLVNAQRCLKLWLGMQLRSGLEHE